MLIDRPQIVEGSAIQNASVATGTAFPSSPNVGELFFLTTGTVGLYAYSGSAWDVIIQGSALANQNATLTNHIADDSRHLTAAQNTFLDGLNLPTLTAAQVNFVSGVTSNIQSQLNSVIAVNAQQTSDIAALQGTQSSGQGAIQTQLNNHIADDSRHLTAAQNTFLDGITVDFLQVNKLNGIASYLGSNTLATKLSALDSGKLNIDGSNSMAGVLNMGANRIIGVATPMLSSDAANKDYVDSFVQGLHWAESARVATIQDISLLGLQTIDGVALSAGNRVLVKSQNNASQNGIWIASNGVWTRSNDFDIVTEINNSAVFVLEGATLGKSTWIQLNKITTLNTDAITWSAFSGPVINSAGSGISLGAGGMVSVVEGAGLTFLGNALIADVHASGGIMTTTDNVTSIQSAGSQLALTNVGAPGTYRSVTTDNKGRVISGTNPTTIAAYGLTDAVNKNGDTITTLAASTDVTVKGSSVWTKATLTDNSQLTNGAGYITSAQGAANSALAAKASTLANGGGNGTAMTFNWSGQTGQPSWLWGGTDGVNMYIYNPSNFSVANATYATTAGTASSLSNFSILPRSSINFNSATYLGAGLYSALNAPANAPAPYVSLISAPNADVGFQIAGGYTSDAMYFRGWYDSGSTFTAWRSVVHSGNIASQSVAYATNAGSADFATNALNASTANSAGVLTGPASTNGSDGFFRSTGNTGWYNSTYNVGIYATESGNVRTYNNASMIASVFYGAGNGLTGTAASLTSGNTTSISSAVDKGNLWTGIQQFRANKGANSYGRDSSTFNQFYSDDSGCAGLSFHRGGAYATSITLDPDNWIRMGGWSAAADRVSFDMESGAIVAAGNITAYSDERLKTNWRDIEPDFISRWAKVKHGIFDRIDSGETQIGLSAQSVQQVVPEAVNEMATGVLTVNYGAVSAVATVKLAEEIVELRKQLQMQSDLIKMLMEKQNESRD
jgi:hypothetical protein